MLDLIGNCTRVAKLLDPVPAAEFTTASNLFVSIGIPFASHTERVRM